MLCGEADIDISTGVAVDGVELMRERISKNVRHLISLRQTKQISRSEETSVCIYFAVRFRRAA